MMASETASLPDQQQPPPPPSVQVQSPLSTDKRSKHRIVAELKLLEQDSEFLQEELEELEKTENVSSICIDLLKYVENRPDPLLPVVQGPVNLLWDRWFEGPQDRDPCRCLIL